MCIFFCVHMCMHVFMYQCACVVYICMWVCLCVCVFTCASVLLCMKQYDCLSSRLVKSPSVSSLLRMIRLSPVLDLLQLRQVFFFILKQLQQQNLWCLLISKFIIHSCNKLYFKIFLVQQKLFSSIQFIFEHLCL